MLYCITFIQRRPNVLDACPTLYNVIQWFVFAVMCVIGTTRRCGEAVPAPGGAGRAICVCESPWLDQLACGLAQCHSTHT